MQTDTKTWLALRATRLIERILNGPRPRLQEGYEQVPEGMLEALMEQAEEAGYVEDDDTDEPVDPDEVRRQNLLEVMSLNESSSSLVGHVKALKESLMTTDELGPGLSEETAEQLVTITWGCWMSGLTD